VIDWTERGELAELAAGRWDGFHGLAEYSLEDADAQLGPPTEDELYGGRFGGEPAEFRRYPATDAAPQGVTCWLLDDAVIGIEIHDPEPDRASLEALGPPDLELDSGLGPSWSQHVWAARGLVVHRRDDRVGLALGLAPIDPETWPTDPLRWWRVERRQR
jgi:hypothetical protein